MLSCKYQDKWSKVNEADTEVLLNTVHGIESFSINFLGDVVVHCYYYDYK